MYLCLVSVSTDSVGLSSCLVITGWTPPSICSQQTADAPDAPVRMLPSGLWECRNELSLQSQPYSHCESLGGHLNTSNHQI